MVSVGFIDDDDVADANDADDLELARIGHGVPRGVAVAAQRLEGDALLDGQVAREERAARRHVRPAGGRRHRDAAVLQLRRAVPGERLLRGDLGESHRVEDLAARLRAGALPARERERREQRCARVGGF